MVNQKQSIVNPNQLIKTYNSLDIINFNLLEKLYIEEKKTSLIKIVMLLIIFKKRIIIVFEEYRAFNEPESSLIGI